MKIKITKCKGVGDIFKNLIPDSIHEVVKPSREYRRKKKYKNGELGYWVQGVGEPVLVLHGEYILVNQED